MKTGMKTNVNWRENLQWIGAFSTAVIVHGAALIAFTQEPKAVELTDEDVVVNLGLMGAIGSEMVDTPPAPKQAPQKAPKKSKPKPKPKPIVHQVQKSLSKPISRPRVITPPQPRIFKTRSAPSPYVVVSQFVPIARQATQTSYIPQATPRATASVSVSSANTGYRLPADMSSSSGIGASGPEQLYYAKLAARMKRYKRYPASARKADQEGTVILKFTVIRNGRITKSKILQTSGHANLDGAALRILKRVQPLPSFPPQMKQKSVTLTYPFEFRLRH